MPRQTLKKAEIDQSRCDRSPACPASRICPTKAITSEMQTDPLAAFFGFGPRPSYTVNEDLCLGCGICTTRCPVGAINMR
ncbi:MAG: 4Fe-4S binding protein [Firmicutes bacterium]|nr:4Fe-4S binding protein [Bacillota bacterium]